MRTSIPRLMVTVWAGQLPLANYAAPSSLVAEAMQGAGSIAGFFMLALAACVLASLVDSLLADALPARYTSPFKDYRHLGFMFMCVSLLMLGGILATRAGSFVLLVALLSPAMFAALVVWPDMKSRHEGAAA